MPPLIVIVGPTASGKSAVGLELARQVGGEIICADARTIYQGMDIGTAKPSTEDQAQIPHHVLDIITPNQAFSAAQFKQTALDVIDQVAARGKVPIMVGGTGLYVDAVLFDFAFREPADPALRAELSSLSVDALQARVRAQGIAMPENERNPRHLIRAIETTGATASRSALRPNTAIYGIATERPELALRINKRVEQMIDSGLEREVTELVAAYGWDVPGMQTIGYREWREYFEGNALLEKIIASIQVSTRHYAKRQQTWFKRNNSIQWAKEPLSIVDFAMAFLDKTS